MSFKAVSWAFDQAVRPAGAKLLLMALANYANHDWQAWPSKTTLARDCASSKSSVCKWLKTLTDMGLIEVEERVIDHAHTSSIITLITDARQNGPVVREMDRGLSGGRTGGCPPNGQGVVRQTDRGSPPDGQELSASRTGVVRVVDTEPISEPIKEPITDPEGHTRSDEIATGFEQFKATFPRRPGVQAWSVAQTYYRAICGDGGVTPGEVNTAATSYALEMEAAGKTGTEYVKSAERWLNEGRYLDFMQQAHADRAKLQEVLHG